MNPPLDKIPILAICIALSVLAHLLLLCPMRQFRGYRFVRPVTPLRCVMVDLIKSCDEAESAREPAVRKNRDSAGAVQQAKDAATHPATDATPVEAPRNAWSQALPLTATTATTATSAVTSATDSAVTGATDSAVASATDSAVASATDSAVAGSTESTLASADRFDPPVPGDAPAGCAPPAAGRERLTADAVQPPLRNAGEFLASPGEKLTYRISMFGIPVGSAELEAKNERGELRITLRVKSAPVLSGVYPVDDLIETRHIGGNFILTRIRQQEGAFRSDMGFTIFLREKKVFWIDRLKNRSAHEGIPNGEVVDLISGLYHLRNRKLQIGRTEMLHVYDSNIYSLLPVEVLRRDRVRLAGLGEVDTIVIKPLLKSDGIFKRTGDVTIWLTDDEYRSPVRVETQIALGKVTVELVAAQ